MARTINPQEYIGKRGDILAAAQRLVYTKGYERMTIGDILTELKISSGAFYHYFPSKPAVLEALIEHMQQEAEKPLLPIVRDEHLSAIEKLQRFFSILDNARTTQKAFLANLARVWFADDNAIVRTKVDAAIIERRTPLLREIIQQGRREGVFTTPYPDQAGEIILVLTGGMGSTLVKLMLAAPQEPVVDEIVAVYSAYADAIERVLGVFNPFLPRPDRTSIQEWLNVDDNLPIH